MRNSLNITLSLLVLTSVISCSANNPGTTTIINKVNETIYIARVSENQGATISFKIKESVAGTGMSTKANTNGTSAKTSSDVDHYLVYLVKNNNTATYPLNGDPLGTDKVAGPFTINNSGAASKVVKFTNIPPLATGAYYVAVRAQDSSNIDLIKNNNGSATAWTGTTASTPKIAVSTGAGVTIDSSYVVSNNSPDLNANLLDAVGAGIDANITPNTGSADTIAFSPFQEYITTIAGVGSGGYSGDSGQATDAQLSQPYSVALDSSGNIYISDTNNNRIRKVNSSGVITMIVGTGTAGYSAIEDSNPATNAKLNFPFGIATDSADNLYIADSNNNRIRKVTTATGIITTIAGGGTTLGDGAQATDSQLNSPRAVSVDNSGNVYIADTTNRRIRKIDTSGIITTIAGTGTAGYTASEDNNPATNAKLNNPQGVATDSSGNVYIADTNNNRIRKINTSGIITTVAGGGSSGLGDGSQATNAQLNGPCGVSLDSFGNLYIADTNNYRLRKVSPSGIITTIIGNGSNTFSGDNGLATSAGISQIFGSVIDSSGNIYFADDDNHRVRKTYRN